MIKSNLPVILLKKLVLLPYQEVRIELNNKTSKKVVEISREYHNNEVLVVCPMNELETNPDASDLPKIGVVGRIKSSIELPNGNLRVLITGIRRVKIYSYVNYSNEEDVLESIITSFDENKIDEITETSVLRKLISDLEKYITSNPFISNSIISQIKGITELDKLTDLVSTFLPLSFDKKINLMLDVNPVSRAKFLIKEINVEIAIIELDNKLDNELKQDLENSQKEYILKEKIKLIKKELGERDNKSADIDYFREKIKSSKLPDKIEKRVLKEIERYEITPEISPEVSVIRTFIDYLLNIPWKSETKDEKDLGKISKKLNESHYGLEEAKTRIIEYIAVKSMSEEVISPIICLSGPPGTGKTTFAESVAAALNRNFVKVSLGGLSDTAELIGHRKTYIGSAPGKIITSLVKAKSKNPVFLLDEIDKLTKDFRGDPASVLLDILDPKQNSHFVDNYIEEEVDLSKVLFILTANDVFNIPLALYDRLEIINISGYSENEKIKIAENHLIKSAESNNGITKNFISFERDAIKEIISGYTRESGVRELDRNINKIIRKIVTENKLKKLSLKKKTITEGDVKKYLKDELFTKKTNRTESYVGYIQGLAYTPLGGATLEIEVTTYKGKGEIKCTGHLGEVINESVLVTIGYIKSNSSYFKIKEDIFDKNDIHINFRENAIFKDGPSAGVAITTVILSYLLNKEIPKNISMSGEITLKGDILPVGGIKEKALAALNANITEIYLPVENKKDVTELESDIKDKIEFIFVKNYNEIFESIFKKLK
jgi:ATP-dependent Lon protease